MSEPTRGNPFQFFKSQLPEDVQQDVVTGWEHARVRYAMTRLRLDKRWQRVVQAYGEQHQGHAHLQFASFNAVFSDFPLALAADCLYGQTPLHASSKAVLPRWFQTFRDLPFVPPYLDFAAGDAGKRRPAGLVFPRKGLAQGLVIHNGDLQFLLPGGSCFLHEARAKRGRKQLPRLVVQPFTLLLDAIYAGGHGWKPASKIEEW